MGYWLAAGRGRVPHRCRAVHRSRASARRRKPTSCDFEYLLHEIRDIVQWRRGDAVLLAEANVLPDEEAQYFGETATAST